MLVGYEIYRDKEKKNLLEDGYIKVNIDTDIQLVKIDEVILNVLAEYIKQMDEVKKYGTAYILGPGKPVLTDIVITDDDTAIDLDEPTFRHYMSTIIPNLTIQWCKTTNNTNNDEKDAQN